jgi:hypothetical protein
VHVHRSITNPFFKIEPVRLLTMLALQAVRASKNTSLPTCDLLMMFLRVPVLSWLCTTISIRIGGRTVSLIRVRWLPRQLICLKPNWLHRTLRTCMPETCGSFLPIRISQKKNLFLGCVHMYTQL